MSLFTDSEAEVIRASIPALSNRPPGVDLVKKLEELYDRAAKIVSGTATVLSGATAVTVSDARLSGLSGSPAVATLAEADGTRYVQTAVWSGDDLVITLSGTTTGDRPVSWIVTGA